MYGVFFCRLGQKANKEPKPREFTNEVIEGEMEDVPPSPRQNVWSNKGAKA